MLINNFVIYFNGEQLPQEYWSNLTDGAQKGEVKFFADIELNDEMNRHVLILDVDNRVVESYIQKTLDTEIPNEFFIASGMGSSDNDDIWSVIKAISVIPFAGDTTNDITPNANNPVVSGDPVTYGSGMIGSSVEFSGSNNLKFSQNFYGSEGFSVDLWFNATDLSGVDPKYIYVNSDGSDIWCKLAIDASRNLVLNVKTPNGTEYTSSPIEAIGEGDWHHVVLIYNTLDKFDIYHNGVIGGSLEIDPLDPYIPQDFTYIASDDDEGVSGRLIGSYDEIRILTDMMDSAFINAEYNNKVDPLSFYTRVDVGS